MRIDQIVLNVSARPRAQPRARHTAGGVVSTTGKPAAYKSLIREEARRAASCLTDIQRNWIKGAIRIDIDWFFAAGSHSLFGYPRAARPDRDNLDKLVLDALVQGGLLPDDASVAQGWIAKWYAPKDGAVIVISPALRRKDDMPEALGILDAPEADAIYHAEQERG